MVRCAVAPLHAIGSLYLSFAFSHKPLHAHTFYVIFPVALLFSLYCWNEFLQSKRGQRCPCLLLIGNILLHVGLAFSHQAQHLWTEDHQAIERALTVGDYHELGERRPGVFY